MEAGEGARISSDAESTAKVDADVPAAQEKCSAMTVTQRDVGD